ncbi:MATE family efflux transporter [Arcanobacterium hippocoleae]
MNQKNKHSTSDPHISPKTNSPREIDRSIAKLALPSLGTLLVEPLLVAVDSTMVGHLGTKELAGLALASTLLNTLIGLCIFLTYATTASTAHFVGKGNPAKAARLGIDGIWLALGLGSALSLFLFFAAAPLLSLFKPNPEVLPQAVAYLQASAFGFPAMLLVLASTGALRGFSDTKSPLIASTAGALINIPLNAVFIYAAGLGVAGAGYGSALAQAGIGIFLTWRFAQIARKQNISLFPSGDGVLKSLHDSAPLIIRTLSLRTALLLQIAAAAALGTAALAANQIVMSMWNFAAYGLDSLAIAAQILIGQGLGSSDAQKVRMILSRCLRWSVRAGIILGCIFIAISFFVPHLMSIDASVQKLSMHTMRLTSLALPIGAVTYMLDGILIGAGDTKNLRNTC